MDEYVKSIKEEVKSQKDIPDVAFVSNYRELFHKFIVSHPEIKIESIAGGDVCFSVAIKDIGLNYQDIRRLSSEIYSYLTVNFIGELLVRENIDRFGNILININKDKYAEFVNSCEHKKFGLKIVKNRFHLYFHISLVQNILTEDFRRELKTKLEKS